MNYYDTKILEFISKAQQKVATLGNLIIDNRLVGDPYEGDQFLRQDLIAGIRSLNLDESDLTTQERIAMVEWLTGQGELDIIPFRLIDHLVYQGSGISGTGGSDSIAHDDTTGLLGGFTGQRYHFSLDERTRLLDHLDEPVPLPITSDAVLTGGIIFPNPDDPLNFYVDGEDALGTTWRIGSVEYGPVMRQEFNFPVADETLSRRIYINLTNSGTIDLIVGELAEYPPETPIPIDTIRLGSWFQSPDDLTRIEIPDLHEQNTDQYLDFGGSYQISAEEVFNKVNESVYDTEQMLSDFIDNTDDTATVQVQRDESTGKLKFNAIGSGSGGGHIIQDEGTPLTQRDTIDFAGAGVTVTDAGGKTVVTIPGTAVMVDATPTNGSSNPVSSDGVFDALALKLNAADASVTNSRTPNGSAGGELSGSYPNPTVANAVIDDANLVSDIKVGSLASLVTTVKTSVVAAINEVAGATVTLADASTSVKGVTRLSVSPVSPTIPIAVGDNDSRMTNSRAPNGTATGSLIGSYPAPDLAVQVNLGTNSTSGASRIIESKSSASDCAVILKTKGNTYVQFSGTNYVIASGTKIMEMDTSGNIKATYDSTSAVVAAPATLTSTGVAGQIAYDGSFIYFCIAANTWIKVIPQSGALSFADLFIATPTSYTATAIQGQQSYDAPFFWEAIATNTWIKYEVKGANSVQSKTTAYSILVSDWFLKLDATGGIFTVTLPTAVGYTDKEYILKKIDSSGNVITVATTSSQTIDGSTTKSLSTQWSTLVVVSDGANWLIKSSF